MRNFVILLLFLLLVVIGYAYSKNPAGCWKIVDDSYALLVAVAPPQLGLKPMAQPETTATNSPTANSNSSSSQPSLPETPTSPNTPSTLPPPLTLPTGFAPPPLPPSPSKKWMPPSVVPAQANWTWTTSDGKSYDDVVITDIKPDTVAITHAMGVARVDISTLPEDLQKQLNYDPVGATFAQAEAQRELDHPYYSLSDLPVAKSAASQLHWPLAWLCCDQNALTAINVQPGSQEDLAQMALNYLKTRSVVVLLNGDNELAALPPILREQQFFQDDDGSLPNGRHYSPPKIVFSDAGITKAFGRVAFTQMAASRETAIDTVLSAIRSDPANLALLYGQPANLFSQQTPAAAPLPTSTSAPPPMFAPVPTPESAPAAATSSMATSAPATSSPAPASTDTLSSASTSTTSSTPAPASAPPSASVSSPTPTSTLTPASAPAP